MRVIYLLLLVFLLSCGNTVVENNYYFGNGQIIGYVQVINEYGNNTKNDSGVTVTLISTGKSVVSDLSGRWVMDIEEPGIYDFAFSRPDCDANFYKGFEFYGGGDAIFYTSGYFKFPIYQINTSDIILDSIYIPEGFEEWLVDGRASKETNFILFADTTNEVSKNKYMSSSEDYSTRNKILQETITYFIEDITNKAGNEKTIYIAAYPGGYRHSRSLLMGLGKRSNVLQVELK